MSDATCLYYNNEQEIYQDSWNGLYHKQPVYCWDNEETYSAASFFYDVEFGHVFDSVYSKYDNYSATHPEHMIKYREK